MGGPGAGAAAVMEGKREAGEGDMQYQSEEHWVEAEIERLLLSASSDQEGVSIQARDTPVYQVVILQSICYTYI